jgi:alpha-maltose-1-phosphate synthase
VSDRKLRIAVLGTRGIPDVMGGVETHCQALYPRLAARGHSVTIFARKGYVPDDPYVYEGVNVAPLWAPKKKSLEAICHTALGVLRIAAQRHRFDLLHVHAIGPALLVPVARFLGLKVVMTHHGPDYDRQKWGKAAKAALRLGERLGCHFAHAVVTVSKHIRTCIRELYGREGIYIPNGVVLPQILPAGASLARRKLTPGRYVLAVGRFVPEKGFHDLLDAWRRVTADWQLVIAGDADHPDDYSRMLKAKAAGDERVVLTGFIRGDELREIYSNAGLFVLPSYHEGLPIALLEAMSYDLPLLASDIPANRELVADEETFRAGDVPSLATRLAALVAAPLRQAAKRQRIESEFNWDLVAAQTERVYQDICGRRG